MSEYFVCLEMCDSLSSSADRLRSPLSLIGTTHKKSAETSKKSEQEEEAKEEKKTSNNNAAWLHSNFVGHALKMGEYAL
jgi:hypothetical protein